MDIVIGGTKDLENQIRHWPTAVLSAANGPTSYLPECAVPHERLLLFFRDTTDFRDPASFSDRHATQFLAFAHKLLRTSNAQRLILHCDDGVGRSPALAYGLLAMAYGESLAIDELLRLAPRSVPNALLVRRLAWGRSSPKTLWATFEDVAHDLGWLPSTLPRLARLPRANQLEALARVQPMLAS